MFPRKKNILVFLPGIIISLFFSKPEIAYLATSSGDKIICFENNPEFFIRSCTAELVGTPAGNMAETEMPEDFNSRCIALVRYKT